MDEPKLGRLLVVDDEGDLRESLIDLLDAQHFEVTGVASGPEALKLLQDQPFDLLLTDLRMPGMDGIELLKEARRLDPTIPVILLTGQGSIASAVEAMREGAFDYVLKPFKTSTLLPNLTRALEVRRLRQENVRLKRIVDELAFESPQYRLVGSGPAMRRVLQLIERIAPSGATVLVRGASGTGKELVARALHYNSTRRGKPMITINCAALQETLLESELFGHEKGAFTGAIQAKRGLIEEAEGGTLFIDEVAEMSPSMQAKLLRVLENGRYRRVGGTQEFCADVRILAATNKLLEDEQKAGRFREDLFYRLNVISIPLPCLKERPEDIPELVQHFLTTRQIGPRRHTLTAEAMDMLRRYDWPGNVRELANVLERAQILAEGETITADDLPESLHRFGGGTAPEDVANPQALQTVERRHIADIMKRVHGNKVQAARMLGVSRRALYRLLERHGIADKPESHDPHRPAAT